VQALVPGSSLIMLPGLGHLAHEERPAELAELVMRVGREVGVIGGR
jgi:magnesium chelatase accessory protein